MIRRPHMMLLRGDADGFTFTLLAFTAFAETSLWWGQDVWDEAPALLHGVSFLPANDPTCGPIEVSP